MKKLIFASGIMVLSCATSCNEEVPLVSGGDQLPVVFGLFNPEDSANYIRLTKSFAGLESAEILAKDPRNLYYDQAEVKLDINSPEGYPITSIPFERVILDDKQPGYFATRPNYNYVLKGPLDLFFADGFQIRLLVRIPGENLLLSAQQTYYSPPEILSPRIPSQTRLSLYSAEVPRIKWVDKYGFPRYVLVIRFNYINRFLDSEQTRMFDIYFNEQSQVHSPDEKSGTIFHIFEGDDFLRRIANGIPADPAVINRSFESIDIIITGLTKEYCDYEETNQIASDRSGQPVTNIVGGMGLFALKVKSQRNGYLLDPSSLDSLIKGRYTKELKFVKW